MNDSTFAPEPATADPLHTAADAMSLAVQAARDGAADARDRVSEMMPAVTSFMSRLVYTTSYAVSFGVVFPTLFVVQALPKDNALIHGLVDGAHAAQDALNGGRHSFTAADGSPTIS